MALVSAITHLYNNLFNIFYLVIVSGHSFLILFFFKSGIDQSGGRVDDTSVSWPYVPACPGLMYQRVLALCTSVSWPYVPACLGLMYLCNRGNIEGAISSTILYLMFVHICFVSYLCRY